MGQGGAWSDVVSLGRHGAVEFGRVRRGSIWQARCGSVRLVGRGEVLFGRHGRASLGFIGCGKVWQAWYGPVRCGWARFGRAGAV